MAAFVRRAEPGVLEPVVFQDADGKDRTLADWQGKVVLLNVWATWCAPCRKEMPALLELKKALGGADFDVVAVSTDRGGLEKPRKFLTEIGAMELGLYSDGKGTLASRLGIVGMPTTLLIGRDGREIGRLIGPAEWSSEDAKRLISAAIATGS
jgi:thiol-disulfide isomerase/thioredoxin